LQEVYERRAELEYATPPAEPDLRIERKYQRLLEIVAGTLPATSLLDAGCGDGRYLAGIAQLSNAPQRLAGIDISERILATAEQTLARAGAWAVLMRANLESLPLPDGSFERILCAQAIEHLLAPELGVAELARVLAPGGRLVLSTDNARNNLTKALNLPRSAAVRMLGLSGRRRLVDFPHASFTRLQVADLVTGCGLEVERIETFRMHLQAPLGGPRTTRFLNAVDRKSPRHPWGDIVVVVARKPM
jgi:SAM-dependent methyltransferase